MKILAALALSVLLSGCVISTPDYEPDVIVGNYYIGFYRPGFGFWTGYGWDIDFYAYGHPGYGHFYRGCSHRYYQTYVSGPHYHNGYYHGHR